MPSAVFILLKFFTFQKALLVETLREQCKEAKGGSQDLKEEEETPAIRQHFSLLIFYHIKKHIINNQRPK